MNSRERYLATFNFKPVDRVPNYELGLWGQTIERWFAEGLPQDVLYHNWFVGEEYFDMDRRDFIPINVGMVPAFEDEVIEETERYVVARNREGIVTKAIKEGTVRGTRPSMDQYLEFPVKDRKDFEEMKKRYDPTSPVRYPNWWDDRVRCWNQRDYPLCLLTNGTFGLYSGLRRWMGTVNLSYAFYDQPDLIEEMLDFMVDFFISVTSRAVNDVDIDYFNFFEDMAFKTGPLVSPDMFKKLFLPRYRKITDYLRSHGIDMIWLDSDGNVEDLIPLFLEAGINTTWPLEAAADMDPVKLRKEYGRDLLLAGGIDKRELTKGKKEREKELHYKIPELIAQGGYIPHLDHTFPPDISYDNFLYYMELKAKLCEGS